MGRKIPELSIVIISLNEEKNLPKILASIKRQKYKNYEIIISDAGSIDKTLEIAKQNKCRIVKGGLPSRGRNNGARVSLGKYLAFLDADVILPSGFLENVMSQIRENKVDIATVRQKPVTKKKMDIFYHHAYNLWQKTMERIDPHSVGTCIIIKRDLFRKIEGFDESIKLAEDHALARKAFRQGARFRVLDADILVSTRRLKKEGRGVIAVKFVLAALHRITLGEIRSNWFKYEFGHSKPS